MEELKAKARASTLAAADPNKELEKESSKSKEEGELSSSDDDELPRSSAAPVEAVPAVAVSKCSQGTKAGTSISGKYPTSAVDFRSQKSLQQIHKNFATNQAPYKSVPPSRYLPSSSSNNLVISFSDDDSGSGSEDDYRRQEKDLETKSNTSGVNSCNKRPPVMSLRKSAPLQRNTKQNEANIVSRKVALSRTYLSSMTKSNGSRFGHDKPAIVQRRLATNQERVSNQGAYLNSSKLQDLRQKIAIRESELKLKSAQQNKETVAGSFKDDNAMNQNNNSSNKCSTNSGNSLQLESNEPEKKRLKVGDSRLDIGGQQEIHSEKSLLASNEPVLQKEKHVVTVGNLPNGAMDGSDMHNRFVGPSISFPKKSVSTDLKQPSSTKRHHHSGSFPRKLTSENSLMRRSDCHEAVSGEKKLMPLLDNLCHERSLHVPDGKLGPQDASLDNASLLDFQSLVEVEESLDKELEEAQQHRRRCEIEERNALKAYRKAQKALLEADAGCTHLYRKRELLTAEAQFKVFNQLGSNANVQYANGALPDTSYERVLGVYPRQNLGSEPSSEPDSSNDPSTSSDEDEETCQLVQSNLDSCGKENSMQRENDPCGLSKSDNSNSNNSCQDPLLLEASLRSELFARLGLRPSSRNSNLSDDEYRADNEVGSAKTLMVIDNAPPFFEQGKDDNFDRGGSADKKESATDDHLPLTSVILSPSSTLKTTFSHMKIESSFGFMLMRSKTKIKLIDTDDSCNEEISLANFADIQPSMPSSSQIGTYSCNIEIDSFWPLCMYDLRGKCNNEECPSQHLKEYSKGDMNQHTNYNGADCQVESSSSGDMVNGAMKHPKSLYSNFVLMPPMYLVCMDILKAEPQPYESVLARSIGHCWRKSYSVYLAISSSIPEDLVSDEPLVHGSDRRIELHGSWNQQSSYFQSRTGTKSQLKKGVSDIDQSLETALLVLSQDTKQGGRKKALSVLSRTLEADPTSVVLWMVYLLIYYSNKNSIGKDDMFYHAIRNSERSYELWLMYINSRMQLDDRLAAYDTAFSTLCRDMSGSDWDSKLQFSPCILDLFLQLLECLRMSGNDDRAIQRIIHELNHSESNSEEPNSLLSNILSCLTMSDRCIFWICCVYFLIYKKLPDVMVNQFERQKEISMIEWPSVQLTAEEQQQAIKLMELAFASVSSFIIDTESSKEKSTLKSKQLFALCHIRVVVTLEGLECSKNLLEKYINLLPSCLQLVLIRARLQNPDSGKLKFSEFEEAITCWPKEVPGVQCIWNQYAEIALNVKRLDLSKELMLRWFDSVWTPQNGASNDMDEMFGLLNLSLYRMLLNDPNEACAAIDRALKVAPPDYYDHCVKEHALFLFTTGLKFKEDASLEDILKSLKGYLAYFWIDSVSQPISRKFIEKIKKPRIQQLVGNILCPISPDSSLINTVLNIWFGPFLLPEKLSSKDELVDFVEAVMEISPCNYQFAMSVCKFLKERSDSTANILYWANVVLVNAIFSAIPTAPECIWVEAGTILGDLMFNKDMSVKFHERAISVYPFSAKLWRSYLNLSRTAGNINGVTEDARERGIILD